jgi:hypothetical protein
MSVKARREVKKLDTFGIIQLEWKTSVLNFGL